MCSRASGTAATSSSTANGTSADELGIAREDDLTRIYFQLADDRLQGRLPEQVSETYLRERYDLTRVQLTMLLGRICQEGWAERRPGYGWEFSEVLTTPEALLQTYRLRMALEPAALTEPGYRLDREAARRCRAAELRLLAGGIETDSPDALHERGVQFHETIVGASPQPVLPRHACAGSTASAGSSPIAAWWTAAATGSRPRSIWASSSCSSRSGTRRRRLPCASI